MSACGDLKYDPTDKHDRKKTVAINPQTLSHRHQFSAADGNLFPSDLDPTEDDVIQGGIGDCWFLATLCAILFQPQGPKFIKSIMRDVGDPTPQPQNESKTRARSGGHRAISERIIVRLYDRDRKAHFLSVPKGKVVDTQPKKIQDAVTVSAEYNKGALWVSALELALTAFTKELEFKPELARFGRIEGNLPDKALQAITGCPSGVIGGNFITDVRDPDARDVFRSDLQDTKFLLNVVLNKNRDRQPTIDTLTTTLFKGDRTKAANFSAWFYEIPPPQRGRVVVGPRKSQCEVFADEVLQRKVLWNKEKKKDYEVEKYLRREHLLDFLEAKNCPRELQDAIRDWLNEKKVLPGKKFSPEYESPEDFYTDYQMNVYKELCLAVAQHRPTILSSREYIGGATSKGHSGGEDMHKGIVSNHAYALKACGEANFGGVRRYVVQLRNPWAQYGRHYTNAGNGHTYRGEARQHAESWIELSDITKYFHQYTVGYLPE